MARRPSTSRATPRPAAPRAAAARAPSPKRPAAPRIRREPALARAHLLDAADRVFARYMPDEVGLREIAAEAGVSHGLVTHYFGTYDALIDATLDRRIGAVRTAVLGHLAAAPGSARGLGPLPALVGFVRDRVTMRLMAWAMTTGRADRPDFFGARIKGLKLVVDAIAAAFHGAERAAPDRRRVEFAVAAAAAMTIGFGMAGDAIERTLGDARAFDAELAVREIQAMVRAYLGIDELAPLTGG